MKNRTDAAKVLLAAGWSLEEVNSVLVPANKHKEWFLEIGPSNPAQDISKIAADVIEAAAKEAGLRP